MTHTPVPWSTDQIRTVAPAVIGSNPLIATCDEHGKVLGLTPVLERDTLNAAAYALLANHPAPRLAKVHAVAYMADDPFEDVVTIMYVTIVASTTLAVAYDFDDRGLCVLSDPVMVADVGKADSASILAAWSDAIGMVTA